MIWTRKCQSGMPVLYTVIAHDDDAPQTIITSRIITEIYIYVLLFGDEKKINHYARTISDIEYIDDCIYRYTDMLNQNIVT